MPDEPKAVPGLSTLNYPAFGPYCFTIASVSHQFLRTQILGGLTGLVVAGAGAGYASHYWLSKIIDANAGHDYELIAAPPDIELVTGHRTEAWAFGPSAPGTELRGRQGEWLRVRFINHLPVATTIHWHGIRFPLEMDGVPYVSQLLVLPGEHFDYKFHVPDADSFKNWYVDEEGGFLPFSITREAACGDTPGCLSTINGIHVPTFDFLTE